MVPASLLLALTLLWPIFVQVKYLFDERLVLVVPYHVKLFQVEGGYMSRVLDMALEGASSEHRVRCVPDALELLVCRYIDRSIIANR